MFLPDNPIDLGVQSNSITYYGSKPKVRANYLLCIRQFQFDHSRQSDFDPPLSG